MAEPELYIIQSDSPAHLPWKLAAGLGLIAMLIGVSIYFFAHGWP